MWSPPRRAALTVCVALLLVFAGCIGGIVPTTDDETTPDTGTPDTSAEQYPPGVASNGTLTNVTALVDAHFDTTANESMALTLTWTGENESGVRRYVHGASRMPYYSSYNVTTDGNQTNEELYWTGSHGYSRATFANQTGYSVFQNSTAGITAWTHDSAFGPRYALERHLAAGNYSVNGTVERDGRTLVRLTADEVSPGPDGLYEAYEGTVLVTAEGVVYDVDSSFVQNTGDTTNNHFEESITLDTDVDWSGPPSWVSTVAHLSISTVESGHALEIRNTGGAALPANASFRVAVNSEPVSGFPTHGDADGTVTTDAKLEPGDAVYVTVGPDGNSSSFTLHDEQVSGEYTIAAASVMGTHENVFYRLGTGSKDG